MCRKPRDDGGPISELQAPGEDAVISGNLGLAQLFDKFGGRTSPELQDKSENEYETAASSPDEAEKMGNSNQSRTSKIQHDKGGKGT